MFIMDFLKILFFCLESKEPKIQDLDPFAKKIFVSLKDLNSRRFKITLQFKIISALKH